MAFQAVKPINWPARFLDCVWISCKCSLDRLLEGSRLVALSRGNNISPKNEASFRQRKVILWAWGFCLFISARRNKRRGSEKRGDAFQLCLCSTPNEESRTKKKKIKYLITKNPILRLSLANWHAHKYFQANAIADRNRIWPNKPNRKPALGKMLFAWIEISCFGPCWEKERKLKAASPLLNLPVKRISGWKICNFCRSFCFRAAKNARSFSQSFYSPMQTDAFKETLSFGEIENRKTVWIELERLFDICQGFPACFFYAQH